MVKNCHEHLFNKTRKNILRFKIFFFIFEITLKVTCQILTDTPSIIYGFTFQAMNKILIFGREIE